MSREESMIDLINSRLSKLDYEKLHLIFIFVDTFARKSYQREGNKPN